MNIREFRKKEKMTVKECADYLCVTPNIVSKLERDKIQVTTGIKMALEKKGVNVEITEVETPKEVVTFEKFLNKVLKKCDVHCDICDKIVIINVVTVFGRVKTTTPAHKVLEKKKVTIKNEAIAIAREVVELTERRLK